MSARRKPKVEVPKPPARVGGMGARKCIYCTNGYIVVGQLDDGRPVTIECGYCLGTGIRQTP